MAIHAGTIDPQQREPGASMSAASQNTSSPGAPGPLSSRLAAGVPVVPPLRTEAKADEELFAIARIGQARQALADMLVCYARLLQSNDDPASRLQLRAELASLLVDKDPDLLDTILDLAGKRRKAAGPRVLELFEGFCAMASRLEATGLPDSDDAWKQLRDMADRLMTSYRGRVEEILPHVKLEGPALRFVPQWLRDANTSLKTPAAADRFNGMLAQSPVYYLDEPGFRQMSDALDELTVARMNDEAEALAAHVCKALNTSSKDDRIKSVAGISTMIESSMDQNSKTVRQLEQALMNACAGETSEAVLKSFLDYLLQRTVALYNRSYFDRAVKHAQTIGQLEKSFRKAMGEESTNPVREACSELSKGAWAKNLPECLLLGGERESAAAAILSAIDRNLSTTLIAAIGREDKIAYAQIYAGYMKRLCPGSARALFTIMSSQNDQATLSRMLAIAPDVGSDEEILEMIFPLLVHNNFELRGAAMQLALDRDNEHTANFIAAKLHDPRCVAQRDIWMGVLTKLRHPAAAQVVIAELQAEIDSPTQDDRRLMGLIEASCAYEDARFGSVLLRMLRSGTGLNELRRVTAVARENAKSLKLAAMRAIARYIKDPRVYECLDRMRREPDQDVARMATFCLSAPQDLTPRQTNVRITAGVAGPLPPAARASQNPAARQDAPQKPRKGFEELERQSNVDAMFQPGQVLSGKHSKLPGEAEAQRTRTPPQAPPPSQRQPTPLPRNTATVPNLQGLPQHGPGVIFSGKHAAVDPSELPDDLFIGLKPLLEGELQDLGLGMTARITCAKNGVMVIRSSLGKGAIYIQNKVVVATFFSGMSDIQALAAIGRLKQARFAYYAKSFMYAATMSVEVSNIETAIREYLDMR